MRRTVALLLVFLLLTAAGCKRRPEAVTSAFHVAAMAGPITMNPLFVRDAASAEVAMLVHSQLLVTDPLTLEPQPRLFTSWEKKDDNLTYVFTIHEEARWSDGVPFTAEDVAFTLRTICHPDYTGWLYLPMRYLAGAETYKKEHHSPFADGNLPGVIAADEKTVVLRLEKPYAPFLSMLTFAPLPAHILGNVAVAEMEAHPYSRELPVSMGPYFLEEWHPEEYVHFRANPDYFLGEPQIKHIFYRIIPNPEAQMIELMAGKLDLIPTAVKVEDIAALDADPYVSIHTNRRLVYDYIALNANNEESALSDPRVRKALSMLIDREDVVKNLLLGHGDPLYGPLLPVHFAYDEKFKSGTVNLTAARRLLLEAGHRTLELRLIFNAGNLVRENIALLFKEQAAKIGVDVQVSLLEWEAFLAAVNNGDYDLAVLGRGMEADPDLSFHWHSKSPGNSLGYTNRVVDELLEQGLEVADKDRRRDIYREVQRLIVNDTPAIWLYARQAVHAATVKLRNFTPHPEALFYNVHEWTLLPKEAGG